jgi:hypothetical protein
VNAFPDLRAAHQYLLGDQSANLATQGFEGLLRYATLDALDLNSILWLRQFCEWITGMATIRAKRYHDRLKPYIYQYFQKMFFIKA